MNRNGITLIGIGLLSLVWAALSGGQRLWAEVTAGSAVPARISYQGLLTDSGGDPLADGSYAMTFAVYDAASGGAKIWEETQSSVTVGGGYFAVLLGSGSCTTGCPLNAVTFSGADRYLETSVDTGSGLVTFPRQQLASVPYALQAEQAQTAPWDGLTGVPAGFADGIDDVGGVYENVVVVAQSGGDFTSVAAALGSISDSSASNRYLVRVMPGTYTETDLVTVKAYVHVQGAGANVTVVTSGRSGGTPGNGAATVDLLENGRLSDLTIHNTGTGTFGIAIYSAETSRAAVVDNVVAEANGAGGTGHYAIYLNDAEVTIQNSILRASGATGFGTGVNAALGIVNISGGFPQPLIKNSRLMGGNVNADGLSCAGNTGTGFAIQGVSGSPQVFDSYLCGDWRGAFIGTSGNTRLHHSQLWVGSTTGAFMVETTGSATVIMVNSGVFYVGNKYTGTGNFACVNSYQANYTPASNGTTPATACN